MNNETRLSALFLFKSRKYLLLQRLNITIENLDFSNQTKIFFLLEEADFSYVLW
jgi:hypothetical protein